MKRLLATINPDWGLHNPCINVIYFRPHMLGAGIMGGKNVVIYKIRVSWEDFINFRFPSKAPKCFLER